MAGRHRGGLRFSTPGAFLARLARPKPKAAFTGWLVMVSGHLGACDRTCPGGRSGHGRPLHLRLADRNFSGADVRSPPVDGAEVIRTRGTHPGSGAYTFGVHRVDRATN